MPTKLSDFTLVATNKYPNIDRDNPIYTFTERFFKQKEIFKDFNIEFDRHLLTNNYIRIKFDKPLRIKHSSYVKPGYQFFDRHISIEQKYKRQQGLCNPAHYTERYKDRYGSVLVVHVYFNYKGQVEYTKIKYNDEAEITPSFQQYNAIMANSEDAIKVISNILKAKKDHYDELFKQSRELEEKLGHLYDEYKKYSSQPNRRTTIVEHFLNTSKTFGILINEMDLYADGDMIPYRGSEKDIVEMLCKKMRKQQDTQNSKINGSSSVEQNASDNSSEDRLNDVQDLSPAKKSVKQNQSKENYAEKTRQLVECVKVSVQKLSEIINREPKDKTVTPESGINDETFITKFIEKSKLVQNIRQTILQLECEKKLNKCLTDADKRMLHQSELLSSENQPQGIDIYAAFKTICQNSDSNKKLIEKLFDYVKEDLDAEFIETLVKTLLLKADANKEKRTKVLEVMEFLSTNSYIYRNIIGNMVAISLNPTDQASSPLLLAAKNKDQEVLKMFLKHGMPVFNISDFLNSNIDLKYINILFNNIPQFKKITNLQKLDIKQTLVINVYKGNIERIEAILSSNNSLPQDVLITTLIEAINIGNTEMVAIILKKGKDINLNTRNEDGVNPVHFAVEKGDAKILAMLLENNANVNYVNDCEENLLLIAARKGCNETVEVLLANGASVNQTSKNNSTALNAAVEIDVDITAKLLAHGANVDQEIKSDDEFAGTTPLIMAAHLGCTDIIETLLAHGANANHAEASGFASLHLTIATAGPGAGRDEIVEMLIAGGANINQKNPKDEKFPLYMAAESGNIDIGAKLLANSADVKQAEHFGGFTPLHIATKHGYDDMVVQLLASGADIETRSKDGKTPAQIAGNAHHQRIVKFLLTSKLKR